MIRTEKLENGLIRTWSDSGFYIHGGFPEADYTEAVDPEDLGRTYVETDIKIPEPEPTEKDYAEAGRILLGEVTDNERTD